jgi:hypothetical protein
VRIKQIKQKKIIFDRSFIVLVVVFFCLPILGYGQKIWLRADLGVTTTPTNGVSNWVFQNPNTDNHEGTQTDTNFQPLLIDDGMNFNPTILFDGNDDYLPLTVKESSRSIDLLYVFAVVKSDFSDITDDKSNWAILDFDRSMFFSFSISNRVYLALNSYLTKRDIYGVQTVNDDIPHIVSGTFDSSDSVNDSRLYVDGRLDQITDAYGHDSPVGRSRTRYAYVGDGSNAVSFDSGGDEIYYDGEIAEIIYYKNELLTTDKVAEINTYLGIKYGITLTQPQSYQLTGNLIIWDKDQPYASRFKHDIAGIFRDDAYTLDQRISKSVNPDAILTIALDNDFTAPNLDHTTRSTALALDVTGLVWGHNGISENHYKNINLGNSNVTYKKRIWYAVDTNFNSSVHLMFSDESIVNGATYYLLTETDGDGDFTNDGVLSLTGVVASNNSVVFSNVNVSNKYFTIADKIPNNYMRHGKFFRDGVEQEIRVND